MPLNQVYCRNCNAPIKMDPGMKTATCNYCGASYVYEESPVMIGNLNLQVESLTCNMLESDFEIISGRLKRYVGSSDTVVIPDTVKIIGEHAFADSESLVKVVIPETVTRIEESCFSGCTKLESVILPDSIVSIGMRAFDRCSSLKSVVLPSRLEHLGDNAFFMCKSLADVTLTGSISIIGRSSFCYCENLKTIDVPEGICVIAWGAFAYSGLVTVYLPDSLIKIDGKAFADCKSLNRVSNLSNVSSVNETAFDNSSFVFISEKAGRTNEKQSETDEYSNKKGCLKSLFR